jgi:hypothetical protein
MALRLGDSERLAEGIAIAHEAWDGIEEGRAGRLRRWMTGLAQGASETGRALISAMVTDLERLGYLPLAADAAADLALLTARSGADDSEAVARAQRLYEGTEVVPVLGPLPETRWLTPDGAGAVPVAPSRVAGSSGPS